MIENEIEPIKKGVYDFFVQNKHDKEETFTCGCGKVFNNIRYTQTHLKYHYDVMPANTSHIFLQKNVDKKYTLLSVEGPDDGRTWWCPCRPEASMDKATFVNHIIYIHKGISPMYKLEHFRIGQ